MAKKNETFKIKEFPQGENAIGIASHEGVLVIATNKAVYAIGNRARAKRLFEEVLNEA